METGSSSNLPARHAFGEFELLVAERKLLRSGSTVHVEPRVFDLITYLVSQGDRAVGRDELISAVWGRVELSDAGLAQAVARARRALGDSASKPRFIETVTRFGYRWVAPRAPDPSVVPLPLPTGPSEDRVREPEAGRYTSRSSAQNERAGVDTTHVAPPAPQGAHAGRSRSWRVGPLALSLALLFTVAVAAAWTLQEQIAEKAPAAPASASSLLLLPVVAAGDHPLDEELLAGLQPLLRRQIADFAPGGAIREVGDSGEAETAVARTGRRPAPPSQYVAQLELQRDSDGWSALLSTHRPSGAVLRMRIASSTLDQLIARIALQLAETAFPDQLVEDLPSVVSSDVERYAVAVGRLRRGDIEGAQTLLEEIILRSPSDRDARLLLGHLVCRLRIPERCPSILEAMFDDPTPRIAAQALLYAANNALGSDHNQAREWLAQGAAQVALSGDAGLESFLDSTLATLHFMEGDYAAAADAEQRVQAHAARLEDRHRGGSSHAKAALSMAFIGDYAQARQSAQRAMELFEGFGENEIVGVTLSVLSTIHLMEGQLELAEDYARRNMSMSQSVPNGEWRADAVLQMSRVLTAQGRFDDSYRVLDELREDREGLFLPRDATWAQISQIELASDADITRHAGELLALFDEPMPPGHGMTVSYYWCRFAVAFARMGLDAQSGEALARASRAMERFPDHMGHAQHLGTCSALVALAQGRPEDAWAHAEEAWDRARSTGFIELGFLASTAVLAAVESGRADEARAILEHPDVLGRGGYRLAAARYRFERAVGDELRAPILREQFRTDFPQIEGAWVLDGRFAGP